MKHLAPMLFALPLLLVMPAQGQDIFKPLQDFVTDLTAPPPAPRKSAPVAPKAVEPETATEAETTPPPVPRPRPEGLGDEETVTPPVDAPEAVPDETDVPAPQDTAEPETDVPVPEAPVEPETTPAEPDRVYQVACPAVIMGLVEAEMTPPLSEGICGEKSPLTVTAVSVRGRMVPLSTPVITTCQMASALPAWLETVDGYAGSMLESPVAEVETGTSYMCRNRNGGDERFTSEHGFANAMDITGFTLEDGRTIGVESNWLPADAPEGRLLRLAHDAACSGFMTVLGPEANAEHHDHLHLDQGCHGQSCVMRLCE